MFVSGPIVASTSSPRWRDAISMIKSTACVSIGRWLGSGSVTPSRPVEPCTSAVPAFGIASGPAQPRASGTSMPPSSSTANALRVVFSRLLLPCTVVTPTRSRCRAANSSATASS